MCLRRFQFLLLKTFWWFLSQRLRIHRQHGDDGVHAHGNRNAHRDDAYGRGGALRAHDDRRSNDSARHSDVRGVHAHNGHDGVRAHAHARARVHGNRSAHRNDARGSHIHHHDGDDGGDVLPLT